MDILRVMHIMYTRDHQKSVEWQANVYMIKQNFLIFSKLNMFAGSSQAVSATFFLYTAQSFKNCFIRFNISYKTELKTTNSFEEAHAAKKYLHFKGKRRQPIIFEQS